MKDVMLDIETLGTKTGSVILSIGAARFSPVNTGTAAELHVRLNVAQQLLLGATVDQSTLEWWRNQSKEAQCVFPMEECPLPDALEQFTNFCAGADRLWGNGPSFDCVLVENLFERVGMKMPFAYYQYRDFRTIKDLASQVLFERIGTFHNALDDAISQAVHVQKVCKALGVN